MLSSLMELEATMPLLQTLTMTTLSDATML